jgi:hypothetical protein
MYPTHAGEDRPLHASLATSSQRRLIAPARC